MSLCYMNL